MTETCSEYDSLLDDDSESGSDSLAGIRDIIEDDECDERSIKENEELTAGLGCFNQDQNACNEGISDYTGVKFEDSKSTVSDTDISSDDEEDLDSVADIIEGIITTIYLVYFKI